MDPQYVILKLVSGDNIIGTLVESDSDTHIVLEHPLTFEIISYTNQFGVKLRDVLAFRRWIDFTQEKQVSFLSNTIISKVAADEKIISFYNNELTSLLKMLDPDSEISSEESPKESSGDLSEEQKGIAGNLNLNFNFENPDHFQMFIENMQISMEALLDEMSGNIDDDYDFEDMEDDVDLQQTPKSNTPKRKRAKNRIAPKESFDLPYDENADPKDPKSWSDNPQDYL